jgi:hypothetical protein
MSFFRRLGAAFNALIVLLVGLITLGGLIVSRENTLLDAFLTGLRFTDLSRLFLQVATITLALLALAGVLNLLIVHLGRIRYRRGGWVYSLVLVICTLGVLILAALERSGALTDQPPVTTVLLETVQVSVESALAGLVLFALVFGAYRMLMRRVTWGRVVFTLTLLVLLIAALPLPELNFFQSIRDWLLAVPVSAGARGILLGIALATVVVGVRILVGQDQSYKE